MAESLPSRRDDAIVAEPAAGDLTAAAEEAAAFHRRGMLAEAEARYAAILRADPRHFDALHLLGILRQQQGNAAEAARLIDAALKLNPRSVAAGRFAARFGRLVPGQQNPARPSRRAPRATRRGAAGAVSGTAT